MGEDRTDATITGTAAGEATGGPTQEPFAAPAPPDLRVREHERYEVVAEHGRGGLGRVLRARDKDLGRDVAIKEILTRTPAAEARFVREAMITARLEHPGIVPVHDAGRWPDGTPFYAMKLVSGRPLKQLIQSAATLGERLALLPHVVAVADALAYAHDRGIVHRDLKPSNLIVGEFGETIVIDWGLAKDARMAEPVPAMGLEPVSADDDLTRTGAVLGTPSYMPPEQARGEDIDERADVYALGAVLYHLLGGSPPYGGSKADVLTRLLTSLPQPIESLAHDVPPELAAIVRKAMMRDPGDRYRNARLLAEDLRRFLTGQLVAAHDYSRRALFARWFRRHRLPVLVSFAAFVALAVVGIVSVNGIVASKREAQAERAVAIEGRKEAESARRHAVDRANELILTQARNNLDRDPTASIAWLKAYPDDGKDLEAAHWIAADAASRGVASLVFLKDVNRAIDVLTLGDSRTVAIAARGDRVGLWDIDSRRLIVSIPTDVVHNAITTTLDRRRIAVLASEGPIALLDAPDWKVRWLPGCDKTTTAIALWPEGNRLACADQTPGIHVVEIGDGSIRTMATSPGLTAITALAIPSDGRIVFAGYSDGTISAWSVEGLEIFRYQADRGSLAVERLRCSNDGRFVLASYLDGKSVALEAHSGRSSPLALRAFSPANSISRTGRYLAFESGASSVELLDVRGGGRQYLRGPGAAVDSIDFSPDESYLAAGLEDGTIALWNLETHQLSALRGQSAAVMVLSFSRDGRWLLSASIDRTIRFWPLKASASRQVRASRQTIFHLVTARGNSWVASDGQDREIQLWNPETGKVRVFSAEKSVVMNVAMSPDGTEIAGAGHDGTIWTWNVRTGAGLARHLHSAVVTHVDYSSSGRWLASASMDGLIVISDVSTGHERRLNGHEGQVLALEFAPRGPWLASAGRDGTIRLWNAETAETKILAHERQGIRALEFSPDGRFLASGHLDGTVRLWDLSSGSAVILGTHPDRLHALAFSPDGISLASAGDDGTVWIWDVASRRHRALGSHDATVQQVVFSPDGEYLASASFDRTARVWRLKDGAMAVLRGHEQEVMSVAFADGGKLVMTAGAEGAVRAWRLSELAFPPHDQVSFRKWLGELSSVPAAAPN